MAGNAVNIEFAGDATRVQRASRQAADSVEQVGDAAGRAAGDMATGGQSADQLGQRLGSLGAATSGATDAIDSLSGGLQAVADIQDYARDRAARLARAHVDVLQATEDLAQAQRDLKQSSIDADQAALDLTQAQLDQKTALDEYNKAVREHGASSDEAKQAQIDLQQAGIDVKQAHEDAAQATRDASQANIDAKTAQVDLNDAMHEANPPELQGWIDKINLVTPLISAVVGILGLVTAAQWLFNASLWASPITWIVLGIVALIAVIVLLVKNWDWVKEKGAAAWNWIKSAASSAWEWMKRIPGRIADAFAGIGGAISRPFKSAFNAISDAWNNTVGALSWTVPGWIPGIGGNSISAPRLPRFHTGGVIPGMPGQEVPFIGLAGERVIPAGGGGGGGGRVEVTIMLDSDVLARGVAKQVNRRGGNVQFVLGGGQYA